MANQPLTEGQRLFTAFLFGFTGSLIANFIVKQVAAPATPVANEEPLLPQLEDEQTGGL